MTAKVFISCGQRGNERQIAEKVADILKNEFSLDSYLAFKVQSLADIMTITAELRSCDYYLFIDFKRKLRLFHAEDISISLFTHQELALAHNLGFQDMIAFCQKGIKREGFINYVLSNPESFENESELYDKIKSFVKRKGWSKDFSRNLILSDVNFSGWLNYSDHIGTFTEKVCKVRVHNKRSDMAAVRTLCSLNHIILPNGSRFDSPDRNYLKWAWQIGYDKTILPKDFGEIDLFVIRVNEPGIFLHSLKDFERTPIVINNGRYEFFYKLFAEGFPIVDFSIKIDLQWESNTQSNPVYWNFKTVAELS